MCQIATVKFKLSEVNLRATITHGSMEYNVIIGHDLLYDLEIVLSLSDKTVTWKDGVIDIKGKYFVRGTSYHVNEYELFMGKTKRIMRIKRLNTERQKVVRCQTILFI